MKNLFNKCQLELCHNIDVVNAADYYLAAYLHDQATLLKDTALSFVIANYKEVKLTPGFARISQLPDVLLELLDGAID